jgi:hypothetical protein
VVSAMAKFLKNGKRAISEAELYQRTIVDAFEKQIQV